MEIAGVIHSGAGEGAFFTQVQWVVKQCEQMLGYKPFPGTLNIHVPEDSLSDLSTLLQKADFELIPDDPAFCSAQVRKVTVNGIPGAVILPSEEVRIHGTNVLEVIASCSLKETLGLNDGDSVTVSWESGDNMDLFKEVYEFAASAGALEGYVFPRKELVAGDLDDWVRNLVKQYEQLPEETRQHFQSSLDRTMGRAVHSLTSFLGPQHSHIQALKSLIKGNVPESSQDFEQEKEEKSKKYGD